MSEHTIKCRETGEALANKLDGGMCVCKPGECEMRKLRNREGDYAKQNGEDDGVDTIGFAIGVATGFPISPRGITGASILGAILHPIGAILHPTERHAAYDVTSAEPNTQPATPPAPVRDPDWSDNTREVYQRQFGESPPAPVRDPDSPQLSVPVDSGYSPPSTPVDSGYTPASEPSYSAPDPSPPSSGTD